jgi:hypothetical protein
LNTTTLILLCSIPLVGLFAFWATSQKRREVQAMRDFAATLDSGVFAAGDTRRGPRATGRWRGVDVEVAFFARMDPPVFLTTVRASRRPSPVAALLLPRTKGRTQREEPREDAPEWIRKLDRVYDAGCAPREMFHVVMDEETAESLAALENTEIEILPNAVNVQRREVFYEAPKLVRFLDAAVQLARRLEAVHEQAVAPTDSEATRREREVTNFLKGFRG